MAARSREVSRHRILIVDDEESMRLLLARIVSKDLRAEVQLAGTCEQAVRFAGNFVYDAILLDLLMPGAGGFSVLKDIREATPNRATPIIIVSVVGEQSSIDNCLAAGANAYHVKPVRRAKLVAAIKAAIAARRGPTTKE
jgi:two-component system, HptB-dependent secretion and biofilm response regulator